MSPHWTYEKFAATSDLEQGDILQPTEALNALFTRVHPHFRDSKYLGYVVTTQSCDLVLRGSKPAASYISLAVFRPLSQVLSKLVTHVATPVAARRFRSSAKPEVHRLLERLVNQNEQGIGLFFLYTDSESGIAEPAVVFLRVKVALRAEHYETLQMARVGRLTPEFRAKLGWLIGNLYVRPATPDWADVPGGKQEIKDAISRWISEVTWIDDEIVEEADAWGYEVGERASLASLEYLRPPSRMERGLAEIEAEMQRADPNYPAASVKKFLNRLRNNGRFKKLFR